MLKHARVKILSDALREAFKTKDNGVYALYEYAAVLTVLDKENVVLDEMAKAGYTEEDIEFVDNMRVLVQVVIIQIEKDIQKGRDSNENNS